MQQVDDSRYPTAPARIWTSRWQNKTLALRDDLVKVSTSVRRPRFRIGYAFEVMEALAPHGLRHLDGREFDRAYVARLDEFGVDELRRQFLGISRAHDGRDLVLLCYEDVWALGDAACHRRAFASWWQAQTGEVVDELPTDSGQPRA